MAARTRSRVEVLFCHAPRWRNPLLCPAPSRAAEKGPFTLRPLTMDKLHGISRGSSWRRTRWTDRIRRVSQSDEPSMRRTPSCFCTVTPLSVRSTIPRVERDPVLTDAASIERSVGTKHSKRAGPRARCSKSSKSTLWERVRERKKDGTRRR